MRPIALSVIVLAGAIMASAGVIADAMPHARRVNDLGVWGLLLIGFGCVLFVVDWLSARPVRPAGRDDGSTGGIT